MKRWLWKFSRAYGNSVSVIVSVMTFLAVIVFSTWQSAGQPLSDDALHFIYLLFGISVLSIILLFVTQLAIMYRKDGVLSKIGEYIFEGVSIRTKFQNAMRTQDLTGDEAWRIYDDWSRRAGTFLIRFQPYLAPLLVSFPAPKVDASSTEVSIMLDFVNGTISRLESIYQMIDSQQLT